MIAFKRNTLYGFVIVMTFFEQRVLLNTFTYSPRADDEFGEGILGNQKLKKMYYLNVSESGIDSR
jgi:hypothetical protein